MCKSCDKQTEAKGKAVAWFLNLLEDVENYDQEPVQSVLNDYGIFKELANVLIEYQENIKGQ